MRSFPSSKIISGMRFWLHGTHLTAIAKYLKINNETGVTLYHKTETDVRLVSPCHQCTGKRNMNVKRFTINNIIIIICFCNSNMHGRRQLRSEPFHLLIQKSRNFSIWNKWKAAIENKRRYQKRISSKSTSFCQREINSRNMTAVPPARYIYNSANRRQQTWEHCYVTYITNIRHHWSHSFLHKSDKARVTIWASTVCDKWLQ